MVADGRSRESEENDMGNVQKMEIETTEYTQLDADALRCSLSTVGWNGVGAVVDIGRANG